MRSLSSVFTIIFACSPAFADELTIPMKASSALQQTFVQTQEIDPENDTEELLIIEYSGGAHCCSDLTVITKTQDGWKSLDFRFGLDGEHFFNDIDGDGIPELLADKVYQVRGGKILSKPCTKWIEWNGLKYCNG